MLRRTGQQLGASLARKLEVTLELTQNVGDHLVAGHVADVIAGTAVGEIGHRQTMIALSLPAVSGGHGVEDRIRTALQLDAIDEIAPRAIATSSRS